MNNPWRPEREPTASEAAQAIRAQCPDIEFTTVAEVAHGWDNTVFATDTGWGFRFARRTIALPGLQREIDHLPRIAAGLPLAIPIPTHHGTFGDPTWPFIGFRFLPGVELLRSAITDRTTVAAEVGRFLKALHALPTYPGLPIDPFGRADAATRASRVHEEFTESADAPGVAAILDAAATLPTPAGPVVLSHGDLYARHILVDTHGHTTGIIDWGDLCLASPAVDVAIAFSAFDGKARAGFFAAYGPIDVETELRARTFAIFSCAALIAYARDADDPVLEADSTAGLTRATAEWTSGVRPQA